MEKNSRRNDYRRGNMVVDMGDIGHRIDEIVGKVVVDKSHHFVGHRMDMNNTANMGIVDWRHKQK